MTDHPRDDDLLRSALHAEADDVHADDALLARIRSATAPPSVWRRRTPLLAMAAALVVVAGLAAVLLRGDDEQVDVVDDPAVDGPAMDAPDGGDEQGVVLDAVTLCRIGEISPSGRVVAVFLAPDAAEDEVQAVIAAAEQQQITGKVASLTYLDQTQAHAVLEGPAGDSQPRQDVAPEDVSPHLVLAVGEGVDNLEVVGALSDLDGVIGTSQVDCSEVDGPGTTDDQPVAGSRPTLVALVREDGWLVTVDLESGELRELHTEGDPTTPPEGFEEGGPQFIDAVDLSPDGEWIYFSTCCEPADGMTFRIPTEGGEVEEVGFGAYPRVSPDGRFVATAGSAYVYVRPTDDVGFDGQPTLTQIGCCAKHLAWSPDGTELALVYGTGAEGGVPQVRLFAWDGAMLNETEVGKPDSPGWFVLWRPDGMLSISDGEPIADDRSRSQDASYGWILWVDGKGVVKEQAGFETGDVTPIPGLPEALAADW